MFETEIQMRFSDADMLGHINNVNQQYYFDLGKTDFFTRILGWNSDWKEEGVITVAIASSYLDQIRLDERIIVQTEISKIGTKSFTVLQRIINPETGKLKTEGTSVLVAFNFIAQKSIPLPEHWIKKLKEHLTQEINS